MFSDTLTIIKVINFDQKVHWFDISWSECVLFSKSPIQGSKGKSSKTSYQPKPRDSFAKWQLKWAVGHWGWQGANTSCKSSVFKNVCLPSNLWTTFFYISQRPCVFFILHASFFCSMSRTWKPSTLQPKTLSQRLGAGNLQNEWAEKIMDPMGAFWEFPPE